jgi:hypothetical protein
MPRTAASPPLTATERRIDEATLAVIDRRLAELGPYVQEHRALTQRRRHLHRRLGIQGSTQRAIDEVLRVLKANPRGLTRKVLFEELEATTGAAKDALRRLKEQGRVQNPSRAIWRAVD